MSDERSPLMGIGIPREVAAYPHSGRCFNCGRERDDLFYHAQDDAYYCCDVFRCEARVQILGRNRVECDLCAWPDKPCSGECEL